MCYHRTSIISQLSNIWLTCVQIYNSNLSSHEHPSESKIGPELVFNCCHAFLWEHEYSIPLQLNDLPLSYLPIVLAVIPESISIVSLFDEPVPSYVVCHKMRAPENAVNNIMARCPLNILNLKIQNLKCSEFEMFWVPTWCSQEKLTGVFCTSDFGIWDFQPVIIMQIFQNPKKKRKNQNSKTFLVPTISDKGYSTWIRDIQLEFLHAFLPPWLLFLSLLFELFLLFSL